jgi:hypothetical protein
MTRLAALLHWLSGCLHATATTSARDAVYAAPRRFTVWGWLA